MEHKKNIETLLESLKSKGYSRRTIEKTLGYSENYLDQQLVKGGNKRLLNALKDLDSRTLEKAIPIVQEPISELIQSRRSLEKTLEHLSEDKIKSTAIIERLVTLLENNLAVKPDMSLFPTPGGKSTETGTKTEKKPNSGAK